MYSEYTTRFTHSIQFMCILYNLYCIVHIDYTDSQLYFDIILHYIYRMCVKINAFVFCQNLRLCSVKRKFQCLISPLMKTIFA